ncbi:MAG: hypothetical protein JWO53_1326 [Chlamydiia bacterium]|nr:hypothetical protein [Chlamydiia bacterium]
MNHDFLFWTGATLIWTMIMSFYSSQEMALISYNKLRLEYFVKQKKRWALWLNYLLEHPTILFSTTHIGVNCALMASSECARRMYETLGLNPNFAPLTQIPFILIFGELVPMFAARMHAEHISRLGIPFLYLSAKILSPLTAIVNFFFTYLSRLTGTKEAREINTFLSREELQKLIEEHETGLIPEGVDEFDAIIGNIFSLRNKQAFQLMEKLHNVPCVSSNSQVIAAKELFQKVEEEYILIYHRLPQKIIGVIQPQDLLYAADAKKLSEFIQTACFVSGTMHGLELLKRLQEEKVRVAVVLDHQGAAIGAITIDGIFDELFTSQEEEESDIQAKQLNYLEKTFPADTRIADFNAAYDMEISAGDCQTFAELIEETLGRNPAVDDTIFIEPLEITVKETSLFKAKTILIRTNLQR